MTREREREREREQPHGEQCMQCSGYYPPLSLSQTSVAVGVAVSQKGARKITFIRRGSEAAAGNVADGGRERERGIHLSSLLAAVAVERKGIHVASFVGSFGAAVRDEFTHEKTSVHLMSKELYQLKGYNFIVMNYKICPLGIFVLV